MLLLTALLATIPALQTVDVPILGIPTHEARACMTSLTSLEASQVNFWGEECAEYSCLAYGMPALQELVVRYSLQPALQELVVRYSLQPALQELVVRYSLQPAGRPAAGKALTQGSQQPTPTQPPGAVLKVLPVLKVLYSRCCTQGPQQPTQPPGAVR